MSEKYPHIVYGEKSESKKADQYARVSIGVDDNCNDEIEGELSQPLCKSMISMINCYKLACKL